MRCYARLTRLVVILLTVFLIVFPADAAQKESTATTAPVNGVEKSSARPGLSSTGRRAADKVIAKPPNRLQRDATLTISRIYAESNRLRVVLRNGTGRPFESLVSEDMRLKLSSKAGGIEADLRLIDLFKNRQTRTSGNETDLCTGQTMTQSGIVSAELYGGKWRTRHTMMVALTGVQPISKNLASPGAEIRTARPTPPRPVEGVSSIDGKPRFAAPVRPAQDAAPVEAAQFAARAAAVQRAAGTTPSPTPLLLDSGIHIDRPSDTTHMMPGDPLRVQYQFTRIAQEGNVVFELVDGANIVLRTTRPYAPPASGEPDGAVLAFVWELPEDLEPGANYFIIATRGSAFGLSSSFSIGPTGERRLIPVPSDVTPIQVLVPRAGDLVVPDVETDISWTMPDSMSIFRCSSRVNVYAVRQDSGQARLIRSGIDCDDGENATRWRPYAGLTPGRYAIRVVTQDGCRGESGVFRVDACDYAIQSVSIRGGGSLEDGIDVRDSATVSGTFDVRVRWNGIPVPPNLPPGTYWDNRLTVVSTSTGDNISAPSQGTSFTYLDRGSASAGTFSVLVPFSFARDDIPGMRRGRHLPLEFRLANFGASIDSDGANNTYHADLRVLGAADNDLRIAVDQDDFALHRRTRAPGSAPVWRCRFEQEVRMTNLSLNEVGAPAATLASVPCLWEMQYRNDGSSSYSTFASGTFTMENVPGGGTWVSRGLEGHFRVNYEITDRTYRLLVTADPDRTLLDPNRNNNLAAVPFRLPD